MMGCEVLLLFLVARNVFSSECIGASPKPKQKGKAFAVAQTLEMGLFAVLEWSLDREAPPKTIHTLKHTKK